MLIFTAAVQILSAQGTAFTYQGRLDNGANPASGIYDLQFTIYDAATVGNAGGALTNAATPVTNGLFTATLDFGSGLFDGNARWLEIAVRTNGDTTFTTLAPRQPITSTPYAIRSASAATADVAATAGAVSAANIVGRLAVTQLPTIVVTNGASGLNFSGNFTGDGAGLTNLDLLSGNAHGAVAWTKTSPWSVATYPVGQNPLAVMVADLHGTGKLDLISANHNDSSLTIWNNNGNGVFVNSATISLGLPPNSIATADVNGDGKLDIICAVNSPNAPSIDRVSDPLMVLTNDGSGGFQVSSLLPTGNSLYWYSAPDVKVVVADVNADGKPDLIAANRNDNSLTVFTNDGSGGFTAAGTNYLDNAPWTIATADVNGDGKVYLIVGEEGSQGGAVTVLTNAGGGSFVTSTSIPVGNSPGWEFTFVTVADVNGDGKPDVVAADLYSDTLTVLLNNGSDGFTKLTPLVVGGEWDYLVPDSVAVADINGDGKMDLLCARQSGGLVVFSGDSHGGFTAAETLPTGSQPNWVVAADLNADGKLWAICANGGDNSLTVFQFGSATYLASFTGNGAGLTGLNATNITTGTLPVAQLPSSVVTNNASGVSLSGAFNGDGANVTNVDASTLNGLNATNFWTLGGNNVADGQFLGSTNDQALEFKVNNIRALRLEPTTNDANHSNIVNLVGGSPVNFIAPGVYSSVIAGGGAAFDLGFASTNSIAANFSFLGGGDNNSIQQDADNSFLGGGYRNSIQPNSRQSFLGGGYRNSIQSNVIDSFLGGGGENSIQQGAGHSFLGGGFYNSIQTNAADSFLGGGQFNSIQTSATYSFLGGGLGNTVSGVGYGTISGGSENIASGWSSTIGGGLNNEATNTYATVPGGAWNIAGGQGSFAAGQSAQALNDGSFVWNDNLNGDFASTANNQFLIHARGNVGINKNNPSTALDVNGTVTAISFSGSGDGLTDIPTAGLADNSVSAGKLASDANSLAKVTAGNISWNGTAISFNTNAHLNDQTLYLRGGSDINHGLGWFNTTKPFPGFTQDGPVLFGYSGGGLGTLDNGGATNLALQWTPTSVTVNGTFNNNSDRNAKSGFAPIAPAAILEKVTQLPITEWNYKVDMATRHIGPMAQDFYAVFNVGTDERHIAPIDENGVALAAIQGLNQKLNEKDVEIQDLKQSVADLKKMVQALAEKK